MQLHATNQKIGGVKWKNGWISVVDSYLTLSHQSLYKEDDAPRLHMIEREVIEGRY